MKDKQSFVLVKLDKKTVLAATQHSFVIKAKVKMKDGGTTWLSKYYYSELGDAIRGYARYVLRRPSTAKHLDGEMKSLIEVVGKLENTIKQIGDKINLDFAVRLEDPVENHIIAGKDDL